MNPLHDEKEVETIYNAFYISYSSSWPSTVTGGGDGIEADCSMACLHLSVHYHSATALSGGNASVKHQRSTWTACKWQVDDGDSDYGLYNINNVPNAMQEEYL